MQHHLVVVIIIRDRGTRCLQETSCRILMVVAESTVMCHPIVGNISVAPLHRHPGDSMCRSKPRRRPAWHPAWIFLALTHSYLLAVAPPLFWLPHPLLSSCHQSITSPSSFNYNSDVASVSQVSEAEKRKEQNLNRMMGTSRRQNNKSNHCVLP